MTRALLSNNALTTLSAAMAIGDTTFSVVAAAGFPGVTTASGNYFYGTLVDGEGIPEIVKVTNITGNTFTCSRGQDNTAARAFASGAAVSLRLTAAVLAELQDMASKDASGGYAGLTGFALNVWNSAKSFKALLSFAGTANRSQLLQDKDGTVALMSDIADERTVAATLVNKTLMSPVINAIDGTPIGQITPAAVKATTLSSTGALTTLGIKEVGSSLGLNANPSAWGASYSAVQPSGSISAAFASKNRLTVSTNCYNDGTNWRYIEAGPSFASLYRQSFATGGHAFDVAPQGFAGNVVAFTQAMVLDPSGNIANIGSSTIGSFTVATRPAHGAGKMIYVSDGGAGAVFQGSNGSAWVNLG